MRLTISGAMLLLITACGRPRQDTAGMQAQIDSLQHQLDNSYRPGLGEFMSGIQVHHAKLWFAGSAANWALSDFETKEIRESIDDIEQYCTSRPEVTSLPMIRPALDSIDAAVRNKSIPRFKSGFILLTNTCNSCHQVTKHEFNVIRIPDSPPFSNQVYQPQ